MPSSLDEVRDWMEEGDRLLARAWEHLAASDADPSMRELADGHFSRAAQTYLGGAVEYQRGPGTAMRSGGDFDEPAQLIQRLDGRLRVEAEAAWVDSTRSSAALQDDDRSSVERARTFAEQLRDRFSRAVPEAFNRSIDADVERMDARTARGR
jgi:hypothetical protein